MWVDTHAHLNDASFDGRIHEVLDRAAQAGVRRVVVIGIDATSSLRAVELAAQYDPIFAVVGIQPNSLGEIRPGDWDRILDLVTTDKVVGLGETGLDRHWNVVPIDCQREYFVRHLDLAQRTGLPIVIHCRQAESDVVEVLSGFAQSRGAPVLGVMHSFTGDRLVAASCCDLGLYISFAGMLTFRKRSVLVEAASAVPLDRLLVETDSPYLAPHPFRGKPNEPAWLVHTGKFLAELRGMSVADLAAATTANARRLFGWTETSGNPEPVRPQ